MVQPPSDEASIFQIAREINAPVARAAYLRQACGDDGALHDRVVALLKIAEEERSFLEQSPAAYAHTVNQPLSEAAGTVIAGRYKLLEQIAEGGMGTIWVAQQTEPVRRRVALKLIKPGMDSRQVLSRFEVERQALALMDHPNIAKVLDGGVTDQGRPFFVMEYVRGVPITEYCDEARLTVPQRLKLFSQVCQAVQHAHQKGVIHRDLKPSNILVCLYDGQPVPKVIDFGLAKAMHQSLTEHTLYTAHGIMVGTPLYMSPEQAEFNNLDIDTRTDVYSLGVILYELLTGSTPLEKRQLKDAALQEILRLIKEEEPTKPSTKLSGSLSLPSIAAQRGLEPAQLSRVVRGDLDWIVMKSMEKERSRRYETANGLARDIDRYLHDQPVEASPPSTAYRFRKFARRNRTVLTTAVLISGAMLAGTVVSAWQAIRATQARAAEAEQRKIAVVERGKAEKQREQAEANFQKARKAVDQYFTLVSESRLLDVRALQPVRKELLEAALNFYKEFAQERTDDPAVLADLAVTYLRVGEIYIYIDRNQDAAAAADQALDIIDRLRREYPDAHEQHRRLAGFWKGLGQRRAPSELPQDIGKMRRTLERLADYLQKFADENPSEVAFQSDLAAIEAHLGNLLASKQLASEAVPHFRKSYALWEKLMRDNPTVPQYHKGLAWACEDLAHTLPLIGRQEEADAMLRQSLVQREQSRVLREQRGRPGQSWRPGTLQEEHILIDLAAEERDYPKAIRLLRQSLATGPDGDYEFRLPPLIVETGDRSGYAEYCRQLLARHSDTKDPMLAERTVKACSILPLPAEDVVKVDNLARRGVDLADAGFLSYAHFARGVAAYRRGNFDAAIDWCSSRRIDRGVWFRDVQADLVVAMSHQRLGHTAEANQSLEAAQRVLSDKGRVRPWHDWLACRAFEREAVTLIKGTSPVGAKAAPQNAKPSLTTNAERQKGQKN